MIAKENKEKFTIQEVSKFLIPSLIGVFMFLFPMKQGDSYNIPLGIAISGVKNLLAPVANVSLHIIVFLSFFLALLCKLKISFIRNNSYLNSLFAMSNYQFIVRIIASVIALLIIIEPNILFADWIFDPNTGGLMYDLGKTLLATFLLVLFIIPLVSDYGLMDFIGSVLKPLIKPLFKLPGRSAVDLVTSWVGGNASGILITSRQYEKGFYTTRDAVTISTMFSVVSLPFCLIIAETLKVDHLFLPLYIILIIVGVLTTVVMVRIPPLSSFKDDTYNNIEYLNKEDKAPKDISSFRWGLKQAIEAANNAPPFKEVLMVGIKGTFDLIFNVLPSVIAIGTIGLILAGKNTNF